MKIKLTTEYNMVVVEREIRKERKTEFQKITTWFQQTYYEIFIKQYLVLTCIKKIFEMTDLYFNVTIKKNKWLELSFFNHIRDIIHSMFYVGQSESRFFFNV